MKKKGFTLAETLISLTVIGVVAAMMLPMANKVKPDVNKAIYIKTYDSLVSLINSVVNNPILYPADGTVPTIDYTNAPLYNTVKVEYDGTTFGASSNSKFCEILAYGLNADMSGCTNNDKAHTSLTSPTFNFTTKKFGIEYTTTYGTYGNDNNIYENGYHEGFNEKEVVID